MWKASCDGFRKETKEREIFSAYVNNVATKLLEDTCQHFFIIAHQKEFNWLLF